ncbi:MAG: YjbQ family protein [Actinomycetota bacterium]|nr:YjbQ family protein [Actinomycetota bacterium]
MDTTELQLTTGDRWVTDVTSEAADFVAGRGDGLLHLFAPHATCGLALFELGAGTEPDVAETLERLLPRDDRWVHRHGSHGHGADHVLPLLVSPSLSIPVVGGRMALGTWQSIVLVDTNADNPRRKLRLSFLAG